MTLAVTALALACGSDPAAPSNEPEPEPEPTPVPTDTAAGAFALTSVDAKTIPATIFSESGYVLQVAPSTAALSASGELLIAIHTIETVAGFASHYADTLRGTWSQTGAVVRFTVAPSTQGVTVGWDGRRITVGLVVATAEGNYVFTKAP